MYFLPRHFKETMDEKHIKLQAHLQSPADFVTPMEHLLHIQTSKVLLLHISLSECVQSTSTRDRINEFWPRSEQKFSKNKTVSSATSTRPFTFPEQINRYSLRYIGEFH